MTAIYNWLVASLDWLVERFNDILDWILSLVYFVFEYLGYVIFLVAKDIFESLTGVITAIPRPPVFATVDAAFCSNFSSMGYFASQVNIGAPLALIMSAYAVRFLIRRIPFIG